MTMVDCVGSDERIREHSHRLQAEEEYEEFLMRKEEAYAMYQEERKGKTDEWADDPEMNIIWAYEQLGTVPYDEYEKITEATERRLTKSNCLFRV